MSFGILHKLTPRDNFFPFVSPFWEAVSSTFDCDVLSEFSFSSFFYHNFVVVKSIFLCKFFILEELCTFFST